MLFRSREVSPPAAVPTVAPREVVTFTLDFSPADARIELDGELLGMRHAEVTRPKDGHRYQLRVSAAGHVPHVEVLTADGNARVERALAVIPAAVEPPGAAPVDLRPPSPSPLRPSQRPRRHLPSQRIDRSFPGAGP